MNRLRYGRAAEQWLDGLPLGNGYQGVVCLGRPDSTTLLVNEGSAWSGDAGSPARGLPVHGGAGTLAAVREALDAGDPARAGVLARDLQGSHCQAFLPFLGLELSWEALGPGISRELDLDAATATHVVEAGRQESFASHPHRVVVHRFTATRPVAVTVTLGARVGRDVDVRATGDEIVARLRLPSDVVSDWVDPVSPVRYGSDSRPGAGVVRGWIEGAPGVDLASPVALEPGQSLTLVVATGTSDVRASHRLIAALRRRGRRAAADGYPTLAAHHRDDVAALLAPCALVLPEGPHSALDTDLRVQRWEREPEADPALPALLFSYGRYLLVQSSRPGGLPANLQGIWNDELPPPWSSDFTLNINTEMTYWAAEPTGLAECVDPLVDLLARIAHTTGRDAARVTYGLPGWVAHHNSDAWGHAAPVGDGDGDPSWANWPMGGTWLCAHLLERIRHSARPDDAWLAEAAWVVAGAVEFWLAWIRPAGPAGFADTAPATSPENRYLHGGAPVALAASTAMDRALLETLVELSDQLGRRGHRVPGADRLASLVSRMAPYAVTPAGTLVEWDRPLEEEDPRHRHQSHLAAVFPLRRPLPPAVLHAARATLKAKGTESTGWSLAWRGCLWARMGDAEAAWECARRAMRPATGAGDGAPRHRGGLYPNLFSAHPPYQIDGNLGLVALMVEMLLDSRADGDTVVIEPLPALPASWPSGSVRGLVATGGVRVDIDWDLAVTTVTLTSPVPRPARVWGREFMVTPGTPVVFSTDAAAAAVR